VAKFEVRARTITSDPSMITFYVESGITPYSSNNMASPWARYRRILIVLAPSSLSLPAFRRDMNGSRLVKATRDDMRNLSPILSADIIEGPNDFHVQVDLPGIEMANLEVTLANNCLNIRAERKRVGDHSNYWGSGAVCERVYGVVQRSIPIPNGANMEIADAKFEGGVLSVTFPKKEGTPSAKKLLVKGPASGSSVTSAK
jgi:HSP20 family molecular chaperone IbpA